MRKRHLTALIILSALPWLAALVAAVPESRAAAWTVNQDGSERVIFYVLAYNSIDLKWRICMFGRTIHRDGRVENDSKGCQEVLAADLQVLSDEFGF